jgi:hypothetical protein
MQSYSMRPGFNPTRRNRNIGTSKQGHGQDNRLKIPAICHDERRWWEQLGEHSISKRSIGDKEIVFVVERTRSECIHSCSVEDVCRILQLLPTNDWDGIGAFLFRQSTRKQSLLRPVWGRLAYAANFGRPGEPDVYSGPAIILEAVDTRKPFTWSKSLGPQDQAEFDRLRTDGHVLQDKGSHFQISSDKAAMRATQLYRTVPHEIGHWVDFVNRVEKRSESDLDKYDELLDRYFARPKDEVEGFAHRYADSMMSRLANLGFVPFDQIDSGRAGQ